MSELICTCHCGGAMFYRHLHAESCVLSREGEEVTKSELQILRDERDRLREALEGILDIGKRDMTNPKYDGYFEAARAALTPAGGGQDE